MYFKSGSPFGFGMYSNPIGIMVNCYPQNDFLKLIKQIFKEQVLLCALEPETS